MFNLVTYFSDTDGGTYYFDRMKALEARCKELGVTFKAYHVTASTWLQAVRAKPYAIYDAMHDLNKPFYFLDCDCELLKVPDFALNDWGVMIREDWTAHDFVHYVRNSKAAMDFVKLWIEEVEADEKVGSHTALHRALYNAYPFFEPDVIPEGYFKLNIADTPNKLETYIGHV